MLTYLNNCMTVNKNNVLFSLSLNVLDFVTKTKQTFINAPLKGKAWLHWILKELISFKNLEKIGFWSWIWFVVIVILIFAVILFLLWKFRKFEGAGERLKRFNYEVHHIAGAVDVSTTSVLRCINILNEFPYFINHPKPPYNYTPFLRACWSGNAALVRYMLSHGAEIHSFTSSKETPVYLAAYRLLKNNKWNSGVLDLLYDAGCPLSVPNKQGLTALHCAANAGNLSLTKWLLMRGAQKTLLPGKVSPYDLAAAHYGVQHRSVAALLHLYCPGMAEEGILKRYKQYKRRCLSRGIPPIPLKPQEILDLKF